MRTNILIILFLLIPGIAYADPGVICVSILDHNVRGCNCPGTCTGSHLKILPGKCETRDSCYADSIFYSIPTVGHYARTIPTTPVKAEKEEVKPTKFKFTLKDTETNKIVYSDYVEQWMTPDDIEKTGTIKVTDDWNCIYWRTLKSLKRTFCFTKKYSFFIEEEYK